MTLKKAATILAILSFLALAGNPAAAHPPKEITVSWDASSDTLTVNALHSVNDPAKHYILVMSIIEGDSQLVMKQYTKQDSAEGFSDSVILKGLKSGTKLRIQLACNIMGSKEVEFKIP